MHHRPFRSQRAAFLSALLATSVVGLVVPAAAGATGSGTSVRHAAPARGCRPTPLRASVVKPLPFGGHAYVYEVNGARATVLEPPASFNPRTASARELSVYGFVRPSSKDGKQLAAWNREIASFRSMAGPGLTLACSSGAGIDRPVATGSPRNATEADGYSVKNSQNYSGYSLGSGNGSTFIQVQGDYTQPSATNDCGCYGTPQESTWVGIGGAGFSDLPLQQRALIQIGTAMNESLS
ncbi:MAG TPA: hypothetical protein VGS21_06725, partial [Acidimicrobiales bacterium]|nr:hypothetical protein [Acidimicrobiales bacterium]